MFLQPYKPKYKASKHVYLTPDLMEEFKEERLYFLTPGLSAEEVEGMESLTYDLINQLYPNQVKWESSAGDEIEALVNVWKESLFKERNNIHPFTKQEHKKYAKAILHAHLSVDERSYKDVGLIYAFLRPGSRTRSTSGRSTQLAVMVTKVQSIFKDSFTFTKTDDDVKRIKAFQVKLTAHIIALCVRDRIGQPGSAFTQKDYDFLTSLLPKVESKKLVGA